MLQHFTGDIQTQIGAVHNAADKAEAIRQNVCAVFHNHHAVGVQFQTRLEVPAVKISGGHGGNEQHCLVGHGALGIDPNHGDGLVGVIEHLLIVFLALVIGNLALAPLPNRHHGVHHGVHQFCLVLVLGLAVFVLFLGLYKLIVLNIHGNGPTDIIGVFPHQITNGNLIQEGGIIFAVGIRLDVHNHFRAHVGFLRAGGNGVAVGAGADPLSAGFLTVFQGTDRHLVRNHKGGVKAHAELTDDVGIVLAQIVFFGLELQRAGLCNHAQILLHILCVHTDAVIPHGDGPGVVVHKDFDFEIVFLVGHLIVRQRQIAQLVDSVGRVGNDFPEEDFLVSVDGVDHQIQKPFGFRFKLSFCHGMAS